MFAVFIMAHAVAEFVAHNRFNGHFPGLPGTIQRSIKGLL